MQISEKLREKLNNIALEGIGHFFFSWDEESAPHILNPYKYHLCEKRFGSAYSQFSEFFLDIEFECVRLLKTEELDKRDLDFIEEINHTCEKIFASIDEEAG